MYCNLKNKVSFYLDGNPIKIYYTYQNITFISLIDICKIIDIPYEKVNINNYKDKEIYVLDLVKDDILFTYNETVKFLNFYNDTYIVNYLDNFMYDPCSNISEEKGTMSAVIDLKKLKNEFQNALDIAKLAEFEGLGRVMAANNMINKLYNIDILNLFHNNQQSNCCESYNENNSISGNIINKNNKKKTKILFK